MYEALWEDLHAASKKSKGFRIRSIWIADVAWQGQSGLMNQNELGNDRRYTFTKILYFCSNLN